MNDQEAINALYLAHKLIRDLAGVIKNMLERQATTDERLARLEGDALIAKSMSPPRTTS